MDIGAGGGDWEGCEPTKKTAKKRGLLLKYCKSR
jgi:hypothetical protein